MSKYRIEMKNIVKIYPPDNVALNNVSFKTSQGEIHSIVGENGAGKSTLMKVLYGMENISSGEIFLNGEKRIFSSPRDAVSFGIGMVHQEFMLIGDYTVIENIILGCEPVKYKVLLQYQQTRKKLEKIIETFRFKIDLDEKVTNISIAAQQKVEIIKLLYREVDTLILDEPTAVLAPQETEELFELLFKMKKEGKTILFISHRLDEVLKISDYVTVLRSGEHIWTKKKTEINKNDLVQAMVGRTISLQLDKSVKESGEAILKVSNLTVFSKRVPNKKEVDNVNFSVCENEIVGIAGIEGNGQYEILQAIMGIFPSQGSVQLQSVELNDKDIRQRHRIISYVPQDRKTSGSSLEDSIENNAIMTHHFRNSALQSKFGLLNFSKIKDFGKMIVDKYQVVCASSKTTIGSLSGGNQQKIIIGRELELQSKLLILDQPVRGLDIGSIEYIHNKILEVRDAGNAVLLVSADLDEIFSLSDRILVMHQGSLVANKLPLETSKEEIGQYMLGVRRDVDETLEDDIA